MTPWDQGPGGAGQEAIYEGIPDAEKHVIGRRRPLDDLRQHRGAHPRRDRLLQAPRRARPGSRWRRAGVAAGCRRIRACARLVKQTGIAARTPREIVLQAFPCWHAARGSSSRRHGIGPSASSRPHLRVAERRKELIRGLKRADRDSSRHLDTSEEAGLTRRDLVKGGLAWRRRSGLGRAARRHAAATTTAAVGELLPDDRAAGPQRGRAHVHRHAPGHGARRRPDRPDQGGGRGGARLHARLRRHRLGDGGQKAITQPGSFDVFSGYFNDSRSRSGRRGNWSPSQISQVDALGRGQPALTTGTHRRRTRATPTASPGDGDAPLPEDVRDRGRRAHRPGSTIERARPPATSPVRDTSVPHNFNMDSMGYNADVIQKEPDRRSTGPSS